MTARKDFLQRIGDLRRQAARRSVWRILADAFLFALTFHIGAITLQKAKVIAWEECVTYPLLALLSLCVSTLLEIRRRAHFVDELIDIDLRFQLKEMLSSAYECLIHGRKSILVDLLIEDASRFLNGIHVKELLPMTLLRRHLMIPALAIVMILAMTIDFLPAETELNAARGLMLDQISVKMERLSKENRLVSGKALKKGRDSLFKNMEAMQRQLLDRSMNTQKVLMSLRDLLEQAQEEQASLAGQLVEELSLQDLEVIPTLHPELREGIPSRNLAQVEAVLGKSFEGDIPTEVSNRLLELKRYNEIQRFLAKSMDEIASHLREEKEDPSRRDEPSEKGGYASMSQPGGGSPESGDEKEAEGPDRGPSSLAGNARDRLGKGPPHEIEGSKTTPVKDPTPPRAGARYSIILRSLPTEGQASLEQEELIRSYRKEVEDVLTNDQIPSNYREYIKNYFLSIGMGSDTYEDESKHH